MSFKTFLCFALVATISAQLAPYQTTQQEGVPSFVNYDLFDQPAPVFSNLSEALADSVKTIVQLKETFQMPSLTFGFAVRGKPILERAWGYLDLENSVPATTDSIYRLASVSKSFTSVIIGRLVDQGLVKYSDPLSLYLKPEIYPPKTWAGHPVNITLNQLLSHTAGEHLTALADFDTYVPGINCTQMIHKFANKSLRFEPGTSFLYSNYGYQLLGAVIESVTKKSYQEVVREFFRQYNLTSSYVETSDLIIHNKARYYMAVYPVDYPKNHKNLTNIPTSIIDELWTHEGYWSSGGLMSNVPDLLRYGQMLLDTYKGRNSNLVSQATLKQMWTSKTSHLPAKSMPFGNGTAYGYGWVISDLSQEVSELKHHHIVWHNGALNGLSTILILYPEEEAVGVALTNKGLMQAYLEAMVVKTMENVYSFI